MNVFRHGRRVACAVVGAAVMASAVAITATPASAAFYTGTYQGVPKTLTKVPNQTVEEFPDAVLQSSQLVNFQTDDPSQSCLNGSSLNVWDAPAEFPGMWVVHNGWQGPQCTYGTWTFPKNTSTPTLPVIKVTPMSYNFGPAGPESPKDKSFVVENTGGGTLEVTGVTVGGSAAGDYAANDGCTGNGLAAGEACTIDVTFTPSANGTRSASLAITSNGGNKTVSLTGQGDVDAPRSSFSISDNAIVLSAPLGTVSGAVTDNLTGVESLTLTFTPTLPAGGSTVSATLSCNASRKSCSFTAPAPTVPGLYTVRAKAVDSAGNEEFPGATVSIIVV